MKSVSKVLLVGAVAVMAFAISAAPSEAAKKKKMKDGTYVMQACSTDCGKNNSCKVMIWGADKKWSPSMFPTCVKPACPAAC